MGYLRSRYFKDGDSELFVFGNFFAREASNFLRLEIRNSMFEEKIGTVLKNSSSRKSIKCQGSISIL